MSASIFCLGLYNTVTEILKQSLDTTSAILNATCNYLNGTSSEWYFLPFGFLPASAYPQKTRIQWTYNTYRNTLVQTLQEEPVSFRIRWLSTLLHINGKEYVLDEWLRTLYIVMENDAEFTPELLINCWSLRHNIWSNGDAALHIIDMDGASHTILSDDASDEWKQLLPRHKEESEDSVDEEIEEEEEDEVEVEEEQAEDTKKESPPLKPIFPADELDEEIILTLPIVSDHPDALLHNLPVLPPSPPPIYELPPSVHDLPTLPPSPPPVHDLPPPLHDLPVLSPSPSTVEGS